MNTESEIEAMALRLHERVKRKESNAMEHLSGIPAEVRRKVLQRQRELNEEDRRAERAIIFQNS